jgi:hypothetical protein
MNLVNNKRGVALMVAYALLVIIAVGISVVVYPYLKEYLPLDTPECPADTALFVASVVCDNANEGNEELIISLSNRGLFSIPAAYIRLGDVGREIRFQVNNDKELFPIGPLEPGKKSNFTSYNISHIINQTDEENGLILEIQPAIFVDRKLIPCERAVTSQKIECLPIGAPPGCGDGVLDVPSGEECDYSATPQFPPAYPNGLCSEYDGGYTDGDLVCTFACDISVALCTPPL